MDMNALIMMCEDAQMPYNEQKALAWVKKADKKLKGRIGARSMFG